MVPTYLIAAMLICLWLFPVGHLALALLDRRGLVDLGVILAHLSGYPVGAMAAVGSCLVGLAPGLVWLLTAGTYTLCLFGGLGLRWLHQRQGHGGATR